MFIPEQIKQFFEMGQRDSKRGIPYSDCEFETITARRAWEAGHDAYTAEREGALLSPTSFSDVESFLLMVNREEFRDAL